MYKEGTKDLKETYKKLEYIFSPIYSKEQLKKMKEQFEAAEALKKKYKE